MHIKFDFSIIDELGAGGQGKVYKVINKLELLGFESDAISALRYLMVGTSTKIQQVIFRNGVCSSYSSKYPPTCRYSDTS